MRVKFTTTLKEDTIKKLQSLAPNYNVKYLNEVIETLVDRIWGEEYGLEKKNRDNKSTSNRSGKRA